MSQITQTYKLSDEIQSLLAGLRWRIRAYVWVEGLSLALIWLAGTFWCGLAIDYLPVLVGASELPRPARAILLCLIASVLAWILYRWILRRTFVRLHNRNMALLIERRYGNFRDSLVTSVELSERTLDEQTSPQMLGETLSAARFNAQQVDVTKVLNLRPLMMRGIIAGLLIAPLIWFYSSNALAWEILVNRLYLLKDQKWPRNARIEIVGLEPISPSDFFPLNELRTRAFQGNVIRVARGASVKLVVRADAKARVIPELCYVYFRTGDGIRGSISMNRIGRPKEGFQYFEFSGSPFAGILSNITFDVVGYDHRLAEFQVVAVDAPQVVAAKLQCRFPQYMVDEETSQWLPRTVDITPSLQVPRGTEALLLASTNKPLRRIFVRNPGESDNVREITPVGNGSEISVQLGELGESIQLDLMLHDTDDVLSDRPHRVLITTVRDQPPKVDVRLQGIGSMVTPDVVLPLRGSIEDDYGVAQSWLSSVTNQGEPQQHAFSLLAGNKVEAEVDFRELRSLNPASEIRPKDKLVIQTRSLDRCTLDGGPNEGVGSTFELEVVTSEQLLSSLEGRELALRRRLEQILEEMTETRDSLVRARTKNDTTTGAAPEDSLNTQRKAPEPSDGNSSDPGQDTAEKEAQLSRLRSLRILRTQRAVLQTQKSAQETLGVAAAIRDIRDELTNNRVDTEDRKRRLGEQIADPLQRIGDVDFQELDRVLTELSGRLERSDSSTPETDELADSAVAKNNYVIRELQKVLSSMLDLESYNELLDIIRGLIAEQETLSDATKKQQTKQALDLLK